VRVKRSKNAERERAADLLLEGSQDVPIFSVQGVREAIERDDAAKGSK
jgi:hypothetical protein